MFSIFLWKHYNKEYAWQKKHIQWKHLKTEWRKPNASQFLFEWREFRARFDRWELFDVYNYRRCTTCSFVLLAYGSLGPDVNEFSCMARDKSLPKDSIIKLNKFSDSKLNYKLGIICPKKKTSQRLVPFHDNIILTFSSLRK